LLLLLRLWTLWATRSVVHKSTVVGFWFAQTVVAMGDDAEHEGSVGDRPIAVVVFDDTDRLADQRRADVDGAALPSDLAIVAHASDRVVAAIARFTQHAIEAPRRHDVVLGRGVVAERLVRSFVVVEPLEAAQTLADSGIYAEVIDLRTLLPLDMPTIAASVSKTHRALIAHEAVLNGGFGAEIAARIGSELFDELDTPVVRIGCPFAPIPFAPDLERALLPSGQDIVRAVRLIPGLGA